MTEALTTAGADADVLIIGAGPSGLFASYYAGLRGLSVVLLDSLSQPGGQLMELYPDKPIFDVAGHPEVTGAMLAKSLTTQAEVAEPVWLLGERAVTLVNEQLSTAVAQGGRQFVILTDKGTRISVSSVIIAAGIGSFTPRRLPAVDDYLDRGLHYGVADANAYHDIDVVIVGGGDSAVDWANMLCRVARSVTLVHRRKVLAAHPRSVQQLRETNARLLMDSEVVAAHGTDWLEAVTVRTRKCDETIKAQGVIAALGHVADLGPLRAWGLDIEGRQIVVDSTMATNISGLYAIGDVAVYPGKVRIMAVGFGEAATAVNNLATQLRPGESVFPGHSTDLVSAAAPRGR